ncbi:MAG: cyclic nucleotide-binding domain-containing protein [Gammaproteobacteria bacterium]|nr:cyclic nucleotide-binding domain-containing protein [Gammaproteobacteria bacterium]
MTGNNKLLHVAETALDSHTVFGELLNATEKTYLLEHGIVRSVNTGEIVCEQKQIDTRVFIIVIGEVEVTQGEADNRVVLANLRRGEIFGEISALFKLPRISTVSVLRPTVLLELPGDVLERVISQRAVLSSAVLNRYQQRIKETALRSVSTFRHLLPANLKILSEQAVLSSYPAGAKIISEAEAGDSIFFLIFGTARVSRSINGENMNLALLRSGDYFGEWAVLTGAPRTATVTALTRVEILEIDCRSFLQFIQDNPQVRDQVDSVAYNRHAESSGSSSLDDIVDSIKRIFDEEN